MILKQLFQWNIETQSTCFGLRKFHFHHSCTKEGSNNNKDRNYCKLIDRWHIKFIMIWGVKFELLNNFSSRVSSVGLHLNEISNKSEKKKCYFRLREFNTQNMSLKFVISIIFSNTSHYFWNLYKSYSFKQYAMKLYCYAMLYLYIYFCI